ncbi:hypothetical protein KSF_102810 [Reticulibacter mediterranei]|uniref:Pyrrolo-quinoline quinone repeat domain-containing protein n=1 Tax=Reticulibacter mediterranei TaxID=2778369 RepID=A0A8J3ITI6_9CHLR|nr:PQQ-binding-like beta-propeller repeat protein [Reticulibacter mediterranei]GHP00234.1 hypothetical protein KSF_102810 [Reticulibacter mediterranei]
MDEERPTAAIYAGSLAYTYEYCTVGVPTTPYTRWSFALLNEAYLTCPILVQHERVYLADSAGSFSALDARSGKLLWSFATDWVEHHENTSKNSYEGVKSFCLDGVRGYVLSARETLYELDLDTGVLLRSWDREVLADKGLEKYPYESYAFFSAEHSFDDYDPIECVFLYENLLFIGTECQVWRFDLTTEQFAPETIPVGMRKCWSPLLYHGDDGSNDVIFGFIDSKVDTGVDGRFLAAADCSLFGRLYPLVKMAERPFPRSYLWDVSGDFGNGIGNHRMLLANNAFYALGWNHGWGEDALVDDERDDGSDAFLFALDPHTSEILWHAPYDASCALAAASHLLFVVNPLSGEVEAIDTLTQQRCWKRGELGAVSHPLIADGLLFVFGREGQMIALDVQTGALRWKQHVEGEMIAAFNTIDDGTLFVATLHVLYALSAG